ncbi:electron transport complex protein RnfG [Arsukibacterium tuosuense]|uniref:Ion-translocating oxidoreductase complex subunit G n=1 Tax=Arsukibacterium tuosuense TaxID=1323745 RepID=A0A285I7U8_9GAMM|nr:electron transport complex subunit RsxG [Arsukibacterium tuosuense]SNY44050.1 electron transport complex protein RnfG [Arsukibacterium tuosuense]
MILPISKNAMLLAAVALVCVAILGFINQLTQPKIAEQKLANKLAILNDVLPQNSATESLLADCILVTSEQLLGRPTPQAIYRLRDGDKISAFVVETTAPDGYSGNIDLMVAVTPAGTVLGSRVLNHQETPGLGDKIERRRSAWIDSFQAKQVSPDNQAAWAVRKDGGQFDQFTGATITPRAVVTAVYNAGLLILQQPGLANRPANCGASQ